MKGSPILSTITATLIMAAAYLWLHLTLYSSSPITDIAQTTSANHETNQATLISQNRLACYIEAHFSTPPKKFIISHPISGKTIISKTNLTDNEWSGEITIHKAETADLNVYATWEPDSTNKQNFLQLVLSPNQMEDSSVTLRNNAEIDTTATFQLRK